MTEETPGFEEKSDVPSGAGAVRSSRSVKSRPIRIGIPIAPKYPGLIVLHHCAMLSSGFGWYPSLVIEVFHWLPSSSRTVARPAPSTPAVPFSRSMSDFENCRVRSGV